MSESYIQNLFAQRIGGAGFGKGTEIYKFEKIKRAKRAALAANPGAELIDMGVGEPDEMAFPDCVAALARAAARIENRGYADNGAMPYREAAARWMKNVCGVSGINPETQVIHSIGSKGALTVLPNCFINPGDVAIMTTPGYPVFGTHSKYLGGEVFNLPLMEKNAFLPDLSAIPAGTLKRAKTLVLNYPNNPTGASATPEFFARVVEFAKRHNLIVIHDAAYAALVFEGKPLSFLATPGAMDVGVELHSMSKGFNMTGWRLGFVVGNPLIVGAYGDVKDNSDSGQFLAIQEACAYALDHPEITQKIAAKYSRRMGGLVELLNRHGFGARKPRGSFFLYVRAPKSGVGKSGQRTTFARAEDFSQWLITEKLLSTVPWDDAGAYVRFSVTFIAANEAEERRVLGEIDKRLAGSAFEF
ncbi:MAG TPA: LL-diaminopimelate aminotransferase [Tepidisphaeraceae bacterium]|jgi:LL-diaminopimelate aminotransferase|nr:LL-diaminopimelate aminotransferase [Tepidisphaeraceae bacterium]